ncbi:RNA polymerase sigma-70 factor (ECF subfamily) [Dysgonomonas alginatilytica]|uniref:RNA polymerase sigma-70 factor (ECF subfamily) n=1 Tax=Dysgonomonas alginatilytica TaxID=1605892 RepID=A0A2V3PRM8_9BACT|nr:RNA polymerase sigma-70 factor [Dysgonomonas alginatilytica]PXV65033.1 RNA polymerase sigma-70 factor (ECF subfamily) [Dysgonomonas alginatilytica]
MEVKDTYNALFEEIRNDNTEAYRNLYSQFYAPLCMFALRYIQDSRVAEDCVQDVFLKIWKDRQKITISTSVRSYLLTSVRNMCLNLIEKQKLELTYEQYILTNYDEYDAEDLYSVQELTLLIEKAIAKLPEKYQTVFRMSRFENLKNKEIAEQLNVSVKTVEAYMTKSLMMISVEVGKYYPVLLIIYFLEKISNNP